jgi:peptidoglycan/LPS O-acetylase OafA/YrhL
MDFLRYALIFLHILGAAAIFGGWLANFKKPTVTQWQFIGAIVQVVTGLALVGIAEANATPDSPVNHAKIAVKLIVALVILVAAIIGYRKAVKGQEVSTGLAHAVGGMAFIDIAVATLWH